MELKLGIEKLKENSLIEGKKEKGEKALDFIWTQPWLSNSLNKKDEESIEQIIKIASTQRGKCQSIVIVTSKFVGKLIKAMLSVQDPADKVEIILFNDTLSAKKYASLIEKLETNDFSLIGISIEDEDVSFKAAYSCIRKLLIEKYGAQAAGDRMVNIVGGRSEYLAMEASQDDVTCLTISKEFREWNLGNTPAVLLPMALAGIDVTTYLDGIRDMFADTVWDRDGTLYGIAAISEATSEIKEPVISYQDELEDIRNWVELLMSSVGRKSIQTWVYVEKEETDIALPSFPGCSEDGSLNILLRECFVKDYEEAREACNAVMISIPEVTPYTLGQLNGFMEISFGITSFILYN